MNPAKHSRCAVSNCEKSNGKWSRRTWLAGLGAVATSGISRPSSGQTTSLGQARLDHRLELWRSFAQRSTTLLARCELLHESTLLQKPLRVILELAAMAPDLLILAARDASGVQTRLEREHPRILDATRGQVLVGGKTFERNPAAQWLNARLRAAFLPGDGSELIAQSIVVVPAAAKPRIDLEPSAEHAAAAVYRNLSLIFDAKSGAIVQWTVEHAGGDRITAKLSNHRQGVTPDEIAALTRQRI